MATNPNRPAYLDTIASPWGQQVADHVVRRYATPAARDADLAAITAADLQGQVVAILADGTFPPYLMMHNGTNWEVVAASAPTARASFPAKSAATATYTALTGGTAQISHDGMVFNGQTFTIPRAGLYALGLFTPWPPNANVALYQAGLWINGGGFASTAWTGAMAYGMQFFGNDIQPLNAGDTVGLYIWHNAGGPATNGAGAVLTVAWQSPSIAGSLLREGDEPAGELWTPFEGLPSELWLADTGGERVIDDPLDEAA